MLKMTWYFDNDNQLALRWDVEPAAMTIEQEARVRALLEGAYPEEEIGTDPQPREMSLREAACYHSYEALAGGHHCFARSGAVRRRIA